MRNRTKQIVIRLSDEEYAAVKERVEKSGKTQQEYLIAALTKTKIINTEGIKAVVPELKRIGNNLNQIARRCNEGDMIALGELGRVNEELSGAWQLLRQLIRGHQLER